MDDGRADQKDLPRQLPFYQDAFVADSKIHQYLFVRREKDDKSAFLLRWGFSDERPEELRAALMVHARTGRVVGARATKTGTAYEVRAPMFVPVGRKPWVSSIWHLESGSSEPRFVTLYPAHRV